MPTYEYACTQCGQHVEVVQRFAEQPLTTCGVCGGPLRKLFHPPGIVLKGKGFYTTDNRSKVEKPKTRPCLEPSCGSSSTSDRTPAAKPSGGGKADTPSGGKSS
ncbi:MAG: FmdB family zinc ribbon protein [Actinomycetota bacterium]